MAAGTKKSGALTDNGDGLRLKFGQNLELLHKFLATGDKTLVEASPRDRIWGSASHKDVTNREMPLIEVKKNLAA
jgi:predicted NAD-dependent protein-ADP-ribosyltransferase YbiA (DUF1768 family)